MRAALQTRGPQSQHAGRGSYGGGLAVPAEDRDRTEKTPIIRWGNTSKGPGGLTNGCAKGMDVMAILDRRAHSWALPALRLHERLQW